MLSIFVGDKHFHGFRSAPVPVWMCFFKTSELPVARCDVRNTTRKEPGEMSKKKQKQAAEAQRLAQKKADAVRAEEARLVRDKAERLAHELEAAEKRAKSLPLAWPHFVAFCDALRLAKVSFRKDDFAAVNIQLDVARAALKRANDIVPGLVRRRAIRWYNENVLRRERELQLAKDRAVFQAAEAAEQARLQEIKHLRLETEAAEQVRRIEAEHRQRLAAEMAAARTKQALANQERLAFEFERDFVMEVTNCHRDGWRRCQVCILKAAELCAKHGMPADWVRLIENMHLQLEQMRRNHGQIQLCRKFHHRDFRDLITVMIEEAEEDNTVLTYAEIESAIENTINEAANRVA